MKSPGVTKPDFPASARIILDLPASTLSQIFGAPAGALPDIQATPAQAAFLTNALGVIPQPELQQYAFLVGASSGMAVNGAWPLALTGGIPGIGGFPTSCQAPALFCPFSYQTLASSMGNFPVFEGTSLYSLRIDHNLSTSHRLTLRGNVSPSNRDRD